MELFKGRPMAVIGGATLACAVMGWYLAGWAKLLVASAVCLVLILAVVLRSRRRIDGRLFTTAALACLISVCVLLHAYFYFDRDYLGLSRLCGEEHEFTALVVKRTDSGGFAGRFEVEVEAIDGEPTDIKAWLFCEYPAPYQSGYRLCFRTSPVPFEKIALYDGERSALAQGVMLELPLEDADNCLVLSDGELPGLRGAMQRLRSRLAFILSEGVGGEEGALAAAMLLGERDGISDAAERDLSRAGVSHLLALSGLHLSVIVGAVGWILSGIRLPKPLRSLLLATFVLFYLALTGFLLSTVRSAVMLTMVWCAYYSGADSDGVSSVFLAATLILSVSPAAIVDAGFVLSFASALGITVFLPAYRKWSEKKLSALKYGGNGGSAVALRLRAAGRLRSVGTLLLMGLSANCFTIIIVWSVFGFVPLAAPLTNLLLTPLAGPLLALSAIYLPLDGIPLLGSAVAAAIRFIADIILYSCAWVSDLRGAVISLEQDFTPYILLSAALLMLIMLSVKLKHKLVFLLPPLAAATAFAVCLGISGVYGGKNEVRVACFTNGRSDALALCSGIGAVIVDISDGSYSVLNSAVCAANAQGAVEIEALVLTHYHQRHTASVSRLFDREKVRRVWMPYPGSSKDAGIMARIYEAAERAGVECTLYRPGEAMICFGQAAVVSSGSVGIDRSTHPVLRITVDTGGEKVEYIGSSAWEAAMCAGKVDGGTVIFGAHGPVVKSASSIELGDGVSELVFCSEAAAYAAAKELPERCGKTRLTLCPELWRND